MNAGALDGTRVLDLTRLLPGPFCTMLLADLGADVIKIEEPTGDPARGYGALFALVNRNKRSVTLDLKTDDGRDALLRLVDRSDAVVESFRPGVMDRLGLGYAILSQRNARLVYASLSGFGQSGLYRDRPAHDLNYLALAGVLGYNVGSAADRPVVPAAQIADLGGGTLGAVAILAALLSARQTGVGQMVDVSLFAAAVTWLPTLVSGLFESGRAPAPGTPILAGGLAQYDVYATADGRYVSLGALEPKFLANFLGAVERTDLLRLVVGEPGRFRAELRTLFASRTLADWVALLDGVETCFAPVNSLEEAIADPQARALGLFTSIDGQPQIAPPFVFSRTPATLRRPAPALGAHTAEVLAEIAG